MFNKYRGDFSKTRQNREPVFTLSEFSRSIDMPYNTMINRMKATKDKPVVQFKAKTAKYYLHSDLAKWHEAYVDGRGNK
jgi:hypothetical protein